MNWLTHYICRGLKSQILTHVQLKKVYLQENIILTVSTYVTEVVDLILSL